jgi:hypothetical protein
MTLSYAPPTQEQLLDALSTLERHLLGRVRRPKDSEGPATLLEQPEEAMV